MLHGLDQESFDRLFETEYKPFRSRNARTLYNIFIMEKGKEYLTTLDIQTHLDEMGIVLSKKEINAWLRSLQDASLITKEQERGKPTTIAYDDKYTFDKWSLTEIGLTVSEGLSELTSDKFSGVQQFEKVKPDDRPIPDSAAHSKDDGLVRTRAFQDSLIVELRRSGGNMQMNELIRKLVPGDAEINHAFSELIEKGLIDVRERDDGGLLSRVMGILGFKPRDKEVVLNEKELIRTS